MIGRTISRFRILAELGRGGMASVWKARDELLGRDVALKLLDETLARDAHERQRFRREAEISASLEHPSIVPVYEAGEHEDLVYLVMRLVEGETLSAYLGRRLPPIDDALRILSSIADALGYAHARGVVHRDVTTRNVMLTHDGRVYVLDFGLARRAGRTDSSSGLLAGTAAYLAPELYAGRRADDRSDLYSLGVVGYELLTGAKPFQGDHSDVIRYRCLNAPLEPPSALRPEITADVDACIGCLLARDPAERPAGAVEVVALLRAVLTGEPLSTAPVSSSTPHDAAPPVATLPPVAPAFSSRPRYLAVLEIESGDDETLDAKRAGLLRALASALRGGLAQLDRTHVVSATPGADPAPDLRSWARREGANLIVRASARFTGTAVRISYSVLDPEQGVHLAGGHVEGSLHQPFELEDALVASVRAALGAGDASRDPSRRRPPDPAAQERYRQAQSYLRRADHTASIDGAIALLEGLADDPGATAAMVATLGRAYLQKHRLTKERRWESRAAQACERAARMQPSDPEALMAVGELHSLAGRHSQALIELERAVAAAPASFDARLAQARALDAAGQLEAGEDACRQTIALAPEDWRGYHLLGFILFRHGRYAEALGPWRRVTELTPDNAGAHRNLGTALFHLDRYEDAIAAMRRANEIHPDAKAYTSLGAILYFLDRHEECAAALEKAVDLAPTDPVNWGNWGNACRRVPGYEARAREALERAVALMRERLDHGGGTPEDRARLAGWLANLDRREDALAAIREALDLDPSDVHVQVDAAKVYLHVGCREQALHWLKEAVRNGYGIDSLRRSHELRSLQGDAEYEAILAAAPGSGARGTSTSEPEEKRS